MTEQQQRLRAKLEAVLADPRVKKFLNVVGRYESNNNYSKLYGGQLTDDFSVHPSARGFKVKLKNGDTTSAAGRYQFVGKTWNPIAKELGLTGFQPKDQDLAVARLITQAKIKGDKNTIYDYIKAGNLPMAFYAAGKSGQWESMPGHKGAKIDVNTAMKYYDTAPATILHPGDVGYQDAKGTLWKPSDKEYNINFDKENQALRQQEYAQNLQQDDGFGLIDILNPQPSNAMNALVQDPTALEDEAIDVNALPQEQSPSDTLRDSFPLDNMVNNDYDENGFDKLFTQALAQGYNEERERAVNTFLGLPTNNYELYANAQINKNLDGIVDSVFES